MISTFNLRMSQFGKSKRILSAPGGSNGIRVTQVGSSHTLLRSSKSAGRSSREEELVFVGHFYTENDLVYDDPFHSGETVVEEFALNGAVYTTLADKPATAPNFSGFNVLWTVPTGSPCTGTLSTIRFCPSFMSGPTEVLRTGTFTFQVDLVVQTHWFGEGAPADTYTYGRSLTWGPFTVSSVAGISITDSSTWPDVTAFISSPNRQLFCVETEVTPEPLLLRTTSESAVGFIHTIT